MIRPASKRAAVRTPAGPAREPGSPVNPVTGGPGTLSSSLPSERQAAGMPFPETGSKPTSLGAQPAPGTALQAPSPALGVGTYCETRSRRGGTAAGSVVDADATLPAVRSKIAAKMSERELENGIRAILADLPSLLWYHTHDSRRSPSGFPDLVIVGERVIYRELKTATGKVTDAQAGWLHALVLAGQDACVWRPADLVSGLIGRRLAALAGLRGAG